MSIWFVDSVRFAFYLVWIYSANAVSAPLPHFVGHAGKNFLKISYLNQREALGWAALQQEQTRLMQRNAQKLAQLQDGK